MHLGRVLLETSERLVAVETVDPSRTRPYSILHSENWGEINSTGKCAKSCEGHLVKLVYYFDLNLMRGTLRRDLIVFYSKECVPATGISPDPCRNP